MKLRNIDSRRVIKAFQKMGWIIKSQKGSHVKLIKENSEYKHTLIIPIHYKEIPHGTLTDILNNQAKISREEFFTAYKS